MMDSGAQARKQQQNYPHPPAQGASSYAHLHKRAISATTGRLPASPPATISSHARTRSHASGRPSTDTDYDGGARHHIGNVGRGGTLYLQPSRLPSQAFKPLPATPPDSPLGPRQAWLGDEEKGVVEDKSMKARVSMPDRTKERLVVPVPPLSLANHARRRRGRSYSISTASDAAREIVPDTLDLRGVHNTTIDAGRSASAMEMRDGLLNLQIPHYRLGTPRWSARGTAYLHHSVYTASDDDVSSMASHQPYERFPLPPGGRKGSNALAGTRRSSAAYLHPSMAYGLPLLQATSSIASSQDGTPASIFDKIEANPNDPSIVRFAPGTSQIIAATIPRLIVQITSVRFLDYELLSDFFLAYRGFLTSTELLDWLLERMRWAINSLSDTGRIVRVRTFVALRHWILNYFPDDFVQSYDLRLRFCNSVNRLAQDLARRGKRASGDLNIVGELKKCWRRTSAQFYPSSDAMDVSVAVDITPGGEMEQNDGTPAASTSNLPRMLEQGLPDEPERAVKASRLFALDKKTNQKAKIVSIISDGSAVYVHRGSIPASPLSEDSLRILSCSIPFLSRIRPDADAERRAQRSAPRPAMAQRQNSLSRKKPTESKHRRDASFNDALRDTRSPLPSANPEPITLDQLPNIALTGGLVRGLLLTPPPAAITRYAVRSPPMEPGKHHGRNGSEDYFDNVDAPHNGVRRIVGDVRRALSIKKTSSEASSRSHRSGSSNGSRGANRPRDDPPRSEPTEPSTAPTSMTRSDILAARLQKSYRQHFLQTNSDAEQDDSEQIALSFPKTENARPILPRSRSHRRSVSDVARRLGSQISTSPRSIVIIDATAMLGSSSLSAGSVAPGLAPDNIKPLPLFEGLADYPPPQPITGSANRTHVVRSSSDGRSSSHYDRDNSIDGRLHQSFIFPHPPQLGESRSAEMVPQYRGSSGVHASALHDVRLSPSIRQIRRRPGGDLKAADLVQDLVFSTISDSDEFATTTPSAPLSRNFSIPARPSTSKHSKMEHLASSSDPMANSALIDHASSQPHLRPSFRSEAQRLAAVEERVSASGGIEATLARLEGKKARNSGLSWFELPIEHRGLSATDSLDKDVGGFSGADFEIVSPLNSPHAAKVYRISKTDFSEEGSMSESGQNIHTLPQTYVPTGAARHTPSSSKSTASGPLFRLVDADLDPIMAMRKADVVSTALTVQSSFLLDDNESLDDISTDMGDGPADGDSLGVRSFFFDDTAEEDGRFGMFRASVASPTPDTRGQRSLEAKRSQESGSGSHGRSVTINNAASKILGVPVGTVVNEEGQIAVVRANKHSLDDNQQTHLPFVLAFEAEVLAEQFCIIEKDGLDEVDWKDLIALNWQHAPKHIRNWADYLKEEDPNGIDLVIARFNLTVKWAVSEIVLTEAISERARCISKFIHVAVHCLRLRNYASMYQITLALLSSDLARLQRTWTFVPLGDRRMLDRLEILCQPLRNFHNLRLEMESASFAEGCIPFIGLYTHDLTYNAQKPARLEAVRTSVSYEESPTLINFERYQTAAVITKGLLRLLEASASYVFRPHPEALSRCLWLAALEDSEISRICDGLE